MNLSTETRTVQRGDIIVTEDTIADHENEVEFQAVGVGHALGTERHAAGDSGATAGPGAGRATAAAGEAHMGGRHDDTGTDRETARQRAYIRA